ncbi:hypothetical protein [Massilia sp. Leaf139]|uniref:hypothetical protein n=1 Tax=Massilia sp. Leaf139 TaxID=1736272 RepID=UPI0012E929DD|nr:hypothetical protein [Massilia sp. Leaf139]
MSSTSMARLARDAMDTQGSADFPAPSQDACSCGPYAERACATRRAWAGAEAYGRVLE